MVGGQTRGEGGTHGARRCRTVLGRGTARTGQPDGGRIQVGAALGDAVGLVLLRRSGVRRAVLRGLAARRPCVRRRTSGWPPAAASTPTVSSVGAAVTGRRCGEGPVAATSGSVGCVAAAGSGRALAAHAASMAMSGSSSARSSAPARSPPLRASMSASSARTAARSIGSSLSRGSKSRSSSMSAGPASIVTSKSRSSISSPSRSLPTSSFPVGEAWPALCGSVVRGASDARMPTRSSSAGPPSDPA